MMDSTELLLKQIALENSGSERWSCLVDLYEARAQATLSFIQGIPEETALKPGVAGRPLIEVIDHIRAWDQWEIDAGLVYVGRGKKPPIIELRNFVNREGKVVHHDYLPSRRAVDVFNHERAGELRLFMKYRGLMWQKVVEELSQTSHRFAAAAREISAEVADQTELHLWRVLGEPVPHTVYLVAVSTFHIARDGEHRVDLDLVGVNNR